jgi:hypothetical protein
MAYMAQKFGFVSPTLKVSKNPKKSNFQLEYPKNTHSKSFNQLQLFQPNPHRIQLLIVI